MKHAHIKNGEILFIGSWEEVIERIKTQSGYGLGLSKITKNKQVVGAMLTVMQAEHETRDGKGNVYKMSSPPSDTFFRNKNEGRSQSKRAFKAKPIKFKPEIWPQQTLIGFFRRHSINARTTDWFIVFHEPSRKMTQDDQILLLLQPDQTEYRIDINIEKKKLIINNLYGE